MIRIAIIAGLMHAGGKRNLIMAYYRQIDRSRIQFDFICDDDSNGIPEDEIRRLGGRLFLVPSYKHFLSHMRQTYRILKSHDYPIIHAYDNTLNVFPMFLGWKAGIRTRISESISKGDKNEKKTVIKYLLRPFSRWFATDLMANSEDCGIWQFGRKAFAHGVITIFKSVIDARDHAFDRAVRVATRHRHGWEEKVVYGFIGRYVAQKNPLKLIDIFREIANRQADALLVMIGYGDMEEGMMARVRQYGLSDKVVNLGRRDDICQFYDAFDAFLLPSLYEGLPVVGIEAQCHGLSVFFSSHVTEETTACTLANYIDLDASPVAWADRILAVTANEMPVRRDRSPEIIAAGFDSMNETRRLQSYYEGKLEHEKE